MCWCRKEVGMLNSRVMQLQACVVGRWGGGGWRLLRGPGWDQHGGWLQRPCGLWATVSIQDSALHSHSCPLQTINHLLCDLGQVPSHLEQKDGVKPPIPLQPAPALSSRVLTPDCTLESPEELLKNTRILTHLQRFGFQQWALGMGYF